MKKTIKHYYNFNESINKNNSLICEDGWDYVRLNEEDTPFSIPRTIQSYEDKLKDNYVAEAIDICKLIKKHDFKALISYGCGCGYLESNIKKLLPDVYMVCTDFNEKSLSRLKSVMNYYDEIHIFDIKKDPFKVIDGQLCLLFRIDTELSDQEWAQVFKRMNFEKVEYVLVVATEILSLKRAIKEIIKGFLRNVRHYTFCGYFRTETNFRSLWKNYYQIEKTLKINNLDAFFLRRNGNCLLEEL